MCRRAASQTPQDLLDAGLYKHIAIAIHPEPFRAVSLALVAQACGALPRNLNHMTAEQKMKLKSKANQAHLGLGFIIECILKCTYLPDQVVSMFVLYTEICTKACSDREAQHLHAHKMKDPDAKHFRNTTGTQYSI